MTNETKQFSITASPDVMRRIERFLALLHFSSSFGHSGVFAMALDGGGSEKVRVDPIDKRLAREIDLIGSVGYDVELARENSYGGRFIDKSKMPKWYTGPAANLYVDGEVRKTSPTSDWNWPQEAREKPLQVGVRNQGATETTDSKIELPPEAGAIDPDEYLPI